MPRSAELKSSWLKNASYDDETQTLTVTTAKGTTHEHRVTPDVYEQLLRAESPGQFYNANLRQR